MTIRSVAVGIAFAIFVSVVVYFNDHVIQQTYLIGNHFPAVVFGALLLLVLFVNPLIGALRIFRPLSPRELAVIVALGLVVCGWPGSGFFRGFSGLVVKPSTHVLVNSSWQSAQVMSYVPGAGYLLGEGHVRDWEEFARMLYEKGREDSTSAAGYVWRTLPGYARDIVSTAIRRDAFQQSDRHVLHKGLNELLSRRDFCNEEAFGKQISAPSKRAFSKAITEPAGDRAIQRANRRALAAAFPEYVLPAPSGQGVLLADGDSESPAVRKLLMGKSGGETVGIRDIPWKTWAPTLAVWGGMAILLGIASVCLAIVFVPQWRRELLPFPVARFVNELTRSDRTDAMPSILRNKLFWYAFAFVVMIHLINGVHAWFPSFIEIPLKFDFNPMKQLFPLASQVPRGQEIIWSPVIYMSVVGFAYFLSSEVAFSMGFSGILYMIFFSIMLAGGIAVERNYLDSGNENLLRFGAYLGAALLLFYVGRRYYASVVAASLGFRRTEATVASVWATRLLCICIVLSVALLSQYGVEWFYALGFVLLILLMFTVMSRLTAEAGAIFIQPWWMPLGVLSALFGVRAIGPTAYVVMGLGCMILVGDPREAVMPYVVNALRMVSGRTRNGPSGRLGWLMGIVVTGGFIAALTATLYFQYNYGINAKDSWAMRSMPEMPFDRLTYEVSELSAYGELSESVARSGFERLELIQPDYYRISWIALGLGLVLVCSLMRLRFSWWPLHPVAFLVWGTWPGSKFTVSFLIGWVVKSMVMKLGGGRGFNTIKPFMIGLIGGEIFAALGWSAFGTLYYWTTHLVPAAYAVFPR